MNEYNENFFDDLNTIKEQLFDAPIEVKASFNKLVQYFDKDQCKNSKVVLYAAFLTRKKDSIYIDWDPLTNSPIFPGKKFGFAVGYDPKPGSLIHKYGSGGDDDYLIRILEICDHKEKDERMEYWKNYYKGKTSL